MGKPVPLFFRYWVWAVPDDQRCDGPPELLVRGKDAFVAMPVLPRRGHEIGEPIEEPKRRDLDDAVGPRIRTLCDRLVCLEEPQAFWAVSQFYRDFTQAGDERVVELRRDCGQPCAARTPPHTSPDRSHESPRARARG